MLPAILDLLPALEPFGALAVLVGSCVGLMPRRNLLLAASALCSGLFCIHFLRLGSSTGAAMCVISLLQSLAATRIEGGGRPAWLGGFFALTCAAAAALTVATWTGWPSALAGTGALLAAAARLQPDIQRMRLLLLACSGAWIGHNIVVGSVFGLTCDVLSVSSVLLALWTTAREEAQRAPAGSVPA
ncbi:YgjV family protein [Salinarimonas soli]|uniref:YgjV family protein n=1 Tax=Salinarimonas soli TaxID=1638099 RepID=A0A5B2VGK0_9HYPH|nr:YgjV family protein [Salinarimonas soli]KAA2237469.1 YgjV family protein [Salinarimonas soli]